MKARTLRPGGADPIFNSMQPNKGSPNSFDADKLERNSDTVRQHFWTKLKRSIGRIPFAEDAIAAFYCATDGRTPVYVRAIIMGALAYFILPSDVIPDLITGPLGFTDDAAVLFAALRAVGQNLTPEHRERARAWLEETTKGGR